MDKRIPELVAPAGDWPSLRAAVDAGTDSVYFGVRSLNLRASADNFDLLQVPKVMDTLHAKRKKGYLAVNSIMLPDDLALLRKILRKARMCAVDAVIVWDMGALRIARDEGLTVHLSTQASVANPMAVDFYASSGVSRIVLARECTLQDIRRIKSSLKGSGNACQIEVFIHGAVCVSVSGRCFLSYYCHQKSANKGECLQPCRREFQIKDIQEGHEYIVGSDYILSPRDLCTISFVDRLVASGIDACKIEGRMRSAEYGRVVVSAYRQALDAYRAGVLTPSLKKKLEQTVRSVYNRGFSRGFYFGVPRDVPSRALEQTHEKIYAGDVKKFYKKIGVAEVRLRACPVRSGDTLMYIGKQTPALTATVNELQLDHAAVTTAEKGSAVGIKVPFSVRPGDKVFVWRVKKDNG